MDEKTKISFENLIKEYLTKNLKIDIETPSGAWGYDPNKIKISLILDGKCISSENFDLDLT